MLVEGGSCIDVEIDLDWLSKEITSLQEINMIGTNFWLACMHYMMLIASHICFLVSFNKSMHKRILYAHRVHVAYYSWILLPF